MPNQEKEKKVFRLHEEGDTGAGWFTSRAITDEDLKSIKTDGREVATSIPTPFAQIELIRAAFKWVAENGIHGQTAHHKLVSDTLDVAHLFYLYEKYKDKVVITSWRIDDRLEALEKKENFAGFVRTLKTFWNQDEQTYNFKEFDRFYFLINLVNGRIIGSTSPSTLFMPVPAPDLPEATRELNVQVGDDKLFDNQYASLDQREQSFIVYFYALRMHPSFKEKFEELDLYLEEVLRKLPSGLEKKITALQPGSISNYKPCLVLEHDGERCTVFDIPLGLQAADIDGIERDSAFLIKSDFTDVKPCLVLPQGKFTKRWIYTTQGVLWREDIKVPKKNVESVENSRLPEAQDSFYWLSEGNFLTDTILRVHYDISDSEFVTCGGAHFLLPLTETYFKYFSADKVGSRLTLRSLAGGGVEADLRIPVRGGEIVFKKIYHRADIKEQRFHLAILPFFRVEERPLKYTIGLVDDRENLREELKIDCYSDGNIEALDFKIRRSENYGRPVTRYYQYKKAGHLDFIRIYTNEGQGVLVPKFPKMTLKSGERIYYAVDFGTTNTHIEYFAGRNASRPLNFGDKMFWCPLQGKSYKPMSGGGLEYFDRELFPFSFGNSNCRAKFPTRTALVFNNSNTNFSQKVSLFLDSNAYLLHEKEPVPKHLQLTTHLKWSNYGSTSEFNKVEQYVKSILYLIYLKTLSEGINPSEARIIWFYPGSMTARDKGSIGRLWQKLYREIFLSDIEAENREERQDVAAIKKIPESVAPGLYYVLHHATGERLSIDIGGGTSDFAFFSGDQDFPKMISSVRFAGNAIWGDGYTRGNADHNGFVLAFKDYAKEAIPAGKKERKILDQILFDQNNAADFNSFLFSLQSHEEIRFNYAQLLSQHEALQLPILLFFGALGYYSAKMICLTDADKVPNYVLLSGMASQSAKIIDPGLISLGGLFEFFFKRFGGNVDKDIEFKIADNPKAITCKGVLEKIKINERFFSDDSHKEPPSKIWLGGEEKEKDSIWSRVVDKDRDIVSIPRYRDLRENNGLSAVKDAVLDFYAAMDEYRKEIRLRELYGVSPSAYQYFVEMRERDVISFLQEALKFFGKQDEDPIEESLFFYPLIGILNKLAYGLVNRRI